MNCLKIYNNLSAIYGKQGWWPVILDNSSNAGVNSSQKKEFTLTYGISFKNLNGLISKYRDPYFEIALGAILTQNTSWKNSAQAISNLYYHKLLTPKAINGLDIQRLEKLIKPAGYFRQKAKKIKLFSKWILTDFNGNIRNIGKLTTGKARLLFLERWGIGPETADSILLYALNKPVFVIDNYTMRLLCKKGKIHPINYELCQNYFQKNLPRSVNIYREFHALIVASGKDNHNKL